MGVPEPTDGPTMPGARTTTTAGSDGSSRTAGPGPPGLVRTERREMSEGAPQAPPSGAPTIDLSDPAATTVRSGSPAVAGPPAPRGAELGPALEGTLTVARPGEPREVLTVAKPAGGPPPAARDRPLPTIEGYQILGELGRGGMGVVYLAQQVQLNRPCALKMILAGAHAGDLATSRFLAEAQAVARLQHPNIVQIHHISEADGLPYFELEYVEGGSLRKQLDGTPWPALRAAGLVEVLARGVAEAHRIGIVHRDLKPDNVLLAADGTPKITDFGLAKSLEGDSGLTATDSIMGSPSYMAPEQAEGKAKQVGPSADIYALGAILYELLTGRPPFRAATVLETLEQVRATEPVPPSRLVPGLSRDIDTIALKCLQKEPERRYDSAAALADDLLRCLNGEPIHARPVGDLERLVRWARRHPLPAGLTALAVLSLAAGTVVSTYFKIQADARATDAHNAAVQAKASAIEADRRRGEAEAAGAEARDRLSRLNIATGTRYLDAGDADSALLWYARAWSTDKDPAAEESHRLRVGAALAARPELVGLGVHNGLVSDAVFSPDGTRILTRLEGPEAYIWDYERGRLAVPPLRHDAKVWHAAWSHDGTVVATASDDGTARIWSARDGHRIRNLCHPGPVRWLAFAPGSARLATACTDGKVRTWDTVAGTEAGPPLELTQAVQYVAYSGDGTKLLTADQSGSARVWDAGTRKPLTPSLPHAAQDAIDLEYGYRRYPAFSPDGTRVLTAEKAVHVWDAATGERRLGPHAVKNRVTSLGWSPDGTRIVLTLDPVFSATILSAHDGSVEAELRHPRAVQNAVFDPRGERLLSCSSGAVVHLWDLRSRLPLWSGQRCASWGRALAFTRDGRRCLASSEDGTVRVWSLEPTGGFRPYDFSDGQAHRLRAVVGPDGRRRAFDPSGRIEARFGGATPKVVEIAGRDAAGPIRRFDHPGPVQAAFFTADGRTLFAVMKDHGILRWDVARGEASGPLFRPEALETGDLPHLIFKRDRFRTSRDGAVLILVDDAEALQVWDATAGRCLLGPLRTSKEVPVVFGARESAGRVTNAAVSPDGRRVAAASASTGTLAVWDVPGGRLLHEHPQRFRGVPDGLEFSPDGRWVLVTASDTVARVWDAETGQLAGRPLHHPSSVRAGDLAPDGRRVVTQAKLGIYLWDRTTGDLLSRLAFPGGVFARTDEVQPRFGADGLRLSLTDGTTTVASRFPEFRTPETALAPLAELLTCQRLDEFGGAEYLDQGAILANPGRYRRAWLTLREREDDPAAQPAGTRIP